MTIKAILFDFDGTIADTHDAFLEIVNDLSKEFGYPQIDKTQLEQLKSLHYLDIIKQVGIPTLKIPFLFKRIKKELGTKIATLTPYQAIEPTLLHLQLQGYLLGIVTSNSKENVLVFLKKNNLETIFHFVHSGTTLFGKNKIINRVLREHHLRGSEVIYVGDEIRDIDAAKKSKILMISVGWGFNSPQLLAKHEPDFLVYTPGELLEVVEELNRPCSTKSVSNSSKLSF
ncbi:MAG: HAD-IA family hydrolase [Microcystaceae cyanobacterium]